MKIILASNSPRRNQLLQQAEIDFSTLVAHADERYPEDMPVETVPVFLARKKANAVWGQLDALRKKESVVIAADTVVILDGRIIGKPQDAEDAVRILELLSGRTHCVITGVVLQSLTQQFIIREETAVWFRTLTPEQIRYYVNKYKPFDKAGAYAIQEWIGITGVEKIIGDYYNVMGLPVNKVVAALKVF